MVSYLASAATADEVAKAKDILQTTRQAEVALHTAVSAR